MKPTLHSLLAVLLAVAAVAQTPPQPPPPPEPQVFVAGHKLDLQPAPALQDGTLVAPWGAVARAMGALANWYPDESLLVIVGPTTRRLQVQLGRPLVMGEHQVPLTPAAALVDGKFVAPLKPLVEALDCVLQWDAKTRQARIWGKLLRLETRGDDQGVGVSVVTSLPVAPKLEAMPEPRRSFMDLDGIYTGGQPETNYLNLGGVLRVRCGQFTKAPPVTRIVADLLKDAPAARFQPREDGFGGRLTFGKLEGDEPVLLRLRPKLLKVLAASHEPDTLTVTAFVTDPLTPAYDVLRQPYRVLVDLAGAEIAACLIPASEKLPFLGEIKLMEQGRIALYMDELVPFKISTLTAPDRVQVVFARDRIAGKKIVIDPGHGGKDSGARGSVLLEKNVNLDIAKRTVRRLALMGAQPIITRDTDVFIGLYDRPRLANSLSADLFVSIHCNATGGNWTGSGTGTYHYRPRSKAFAVVMHEALIAGLKTRDYGVRRENFCVTRETDMTSILIETLFIDNRVEEKLLAKPEFRQQVANSVCEGTRKYLEGTNSPAPALLIEPEG